MVNLKQYYGCFIGLAIGDAFGAGYEGGPVERFLWKIIGKTKDGRRRYTDDTQMSIDLAESFLQNKEINQKHLAESFANSYRWSRGYGPGAAWLLKKIRTGSDWWDVNRAKYKEGSLGNGAAMRAPILAMCFPKDKDLLYDSVVKSAVITHAHPLAIEGAKLIAFVTHAALHNLDNSTIIEILPSLCNTDEFQAKIKSCIELIQRFNSVKKREVKQKLGNGIVASQSCVTAIFFALAYRNLSYNSMLKQIFSLGGDTDTIGAMAGAIWGAFNGIDKIDKDKIQKLEDSSKIIELAEQLHNAS